MASFDHKKALAHLYKPSARRVGIVDVPALQYLMIDGHGDPNTSAQYQAAIEALYPLAYTLKFMIKKDDPALDYTVMPLEGLWWADDYASFTAGRKDEWNWTMMIMQPSCITSELVERATSQVKEKKNPSSLPLIRFQTFEEGRCAQILHRGPFSDEGPTVERLHAFIEAQGAGPRGKHHEIYLSDIRRAAPEKWRTVVRQPMA